MAVKGLNELAGKIYEDNKDKGFNVAEENIGQTLMLVVSELSEALEADRKDRFADLKKFTNSLTEDAYFENMRSYGYDTPEKARQYMPYEEWVEANFAREFRCSVKDTFEDEIADAIIRILDLCGAFGISIEDHVSLKLQYNKSRDYKHGKNY